MMAKWMSVIVICLLISKPAHSIYEKMHHIVSGKLNMAILVKGDTSLPMMVYVHGGPGYPVFPFIHDFDFLQQYFCLVFYEQRGTGKSFLPVNDTTGMNIAGFIADLRRIISFVKKNYNKTGVVIYAHSWGTNFALLYAARYPNDVLAYLSTGQSVCPLQNERLCYRFVWQKANQEKHFKALKTIEEIDTNHYSIDDALKIRKWVNRYGGIVHAGNQKSGYINFKLATRMMMCPYYRIPEKIRILRYSTYSGKALWNEMLKIDLSKSIDSLHVPVFFILGRYDKLVSAELAFSFFNTLKSSETKKVFWFEHSAHRPLTEEPDRFKEIIRDMIVPALHSKIF